MSGLWCFVLILAPSRDVRHKCVGLRKSEGGGEDHSPSCLEQIRWKSRLVLVNCVNYRQFRLE